MLIRWFLSIILNAIALIAVAQLFDSFHLEGFGTAILASFILSILNVLVKPILIIFTLPITFLTLGLFLFVINAITLMITQGLMDASFVIDGLDRKSTRLNSSHVAISYAVFCLKTNKIVIDQFYIH